MKTKLFPLIIVVLLIAGCQMSQHTVQAPANVNVPEKVLFLSQSGTQSDLFQTVVDLKNNELVVLKYSGMILNRVYRTGIEVDPDDYQGRVIQGTDAPFGTPSKSNTEANTKE